MSYIDTLFFIVAALAAYSLLFLSRNKYVNILIVTLSTGFAAFLAVAVAVAFGFIVFVTLLVQVLFGQDLFMSLVNALFDPFRALGRTLFAYLLVATPFLLALRRRPDLTKQILMTVAGVILVFAVVSGTSFWRAKSEYPGPQNVTAATLPPRPEKIALKRTVYVKQIHSWSKELHSYALCDALCMSLLTDGGAGRVRITMLRKDEFAASARSSVIYRLGQSQECVQSDTPDIDTALRSGREIVIYGDKDRLPEGHCLLARQEIETDTGFIEIALEAEPVAGSRQVERVEIVDLASRPGTTVFRSREKLLSFIAFPPMAGEKNTGLRRAEVHGGAFRAGDFDAVFRQILIDKLGYKIPVSKQ